MGYLVRTRPAASSYPTMTGIFSQNHRSNNLSSQPGKSRSRLGLPRPELAIASEVKDVDSNMVIAGGVTTANFPHDARNFLLSASISTSCSRAASFPGSMI